jgi:predicted Zn-dependent protease
MRPAVLALSAIITFPLEANAYCRTTTCAQQKPPPECYLDNHVGTCQMMGNPLFWAKPCVSFSVQKDGSNRSGNRITADQLQEVVRTCFDNWQNVDCGDGRLPNMLVETYPQVDCAEAVYSQTQPNQNVWMFHDDTWPYEGGGELTIALTLVSFNRKTGEIYDVDVELNSNQRIFALEVSALDRTKDDLQSVVQHESGHFLGLAHSDDRSSTMWLNYTGNVDMRTLEADDVAGMCAISPPVDVADANCNAEPRHGFSTACPVPEEKAGCSCELPGRHPARNRRGIGLLALGVTLLLTRWNRTQGTQRSSRRSTRG